MSNLREVVVDQNYNPTHLGSADWNVIRRNLNRRKWGVRAVWVADAIPAREIIEGHGIRHHRRVIAARIITVTVTILGVLWVASPLYMFIGAGFIVAGVLFAAKA